MTMRSWMLAIAVAAGAVLALPAELRPAEPERVAPIVTDDGLHSQPWFLNSFMDLGEDLAETAAEGKRLAVIFEQRGCPYCRDLHVVNFADPAINAYVRDNFNILQLNLHGDREVTDFDGEVLSEKALARKWGIVFTPTILYFPETPEDIAGQPGRDASVARMPGYFRPFHFQAMFEYVRENRYEKGQHFQDYIGERVEAYRREGRSIEGM